MTVQAGGFQVAVLTDFWRYNNLSDVVQKYHECKTLEHPHCYTHTLGNLTQVLMRLGSSYVYHSTFPHWSICKVDTKMTWQLLITFVQLSPPPPKKKPPLLSSLWLKKHLFLITKCQKVHLISFSTKTSGCCQQWQDHQPNKHPSWRLSWPQSPSR